MTGGRTLGHPERILRRLGVTKPREIDLHVVAWLCGAQIVYRPLEGAEAHIQGRDDRAVITINECSPPERRRYSLAHELGHWQLHRGQQLFCRGDEASTWTKRSSDPERAADAYAADLLMPSFLFNPAAAAIRAADLAAVRELARSFDTSLTATAIRLVERGRFLSAVAYYSSQGTYGWSRQNQKLLDAQIRLPPRLHHESVAFAALHGGQPSPRGRLVRADAWLGRDRLAGFQIFESALVIGGGVLVLLWVNDPRLAKALGGLDHG